MHILLLYMWYKKKEILFYHPPIQPITVTHKRRPYMVWATLAVALVAWPFLSCWPSPLTHKRCPVYGMGNPCGCPGSLAVALVVFALVECGIKRQRGRRGRYA